MKNNNNFIDLAALSPVHSPIIYFGLYLQQMRINAELTQSQLAKRAFCSPTWISKLEKGTRKPNYFILKTYIAPVLAEFNSAADVQILLWLAQCN